MLVQSRFRQWVSAIPLTLFLVVMLVSLRIAVDVFSTPETDNHAAFREFGALQIQQWPTHPELSGPFDLWAGQWWRVPLGGLHHESWWHLAIVLPGLIYLGMLAEPRISRSLYLAFLMGALLVTTLPRWQLAESVSTWFVGGQAVTGFSGVLFALFGMLLFLRGTNRELSSQIGDDGILIGLACGLGCLAFSTVGLITSVDNLSHLAGFFYGVVWGWGLSAPQPRKGIVIGGVLAANGFFVPAFDHLIHAETIGKYHWWLAETSSNENERLQNYQAAVKLEPHLEYPWFALSSGQYENNQSREAWTTLLKGLRYYPKAKSAEELGPRIWEGFVTREQQQDAWQVLTQEFPEDYNAWSLKLLSPRQAALFRLAEGQSLDAWTASVWQLRELPVPPELESPAYEYPAEADLCRTVWANLASRSDRLAAIGIMDELLERNRRAWHLALIPSDELITHYQHVGELMWAWALVMEQLRDEENFQQRGKAIAKRLWRAFPTELRRQRARQILVEVFGVQGLAWQVELDVLSEHDANAYRLDQSVTLPGDDLEILDQQPLEKLPPLNPDHPTSAAEGVLF